jgi:hypothetical protein
MLRQDLPSKTLRFDLRSGPIVRFCDPNRHLQSCDIVARCSFEGASGNAPAWARCRADEHAAQSRGCRPVRRHRRLADDLRLRCRGAGDDISRHPRHSCRRHFVREWRRTWTTPWRDIRSVKILNKKVVVIERNQTTAPNSWFIAMWRHMRYGCDPDNKRLSLARMPAAADGKTISPEDLLRIIENFRQGAGPGTARSFRAA